MPEECIPQAPENEFKLAIRTTIGGRQCMIPCNRRFAQRPKHLRSIQGLLCLSHSLSLHVYFPDSLFRHVNKVSSMHRPILGLK